MKNIILVNLTRFGDQLQSQAAINALAAPGRRICLVCLPNFAAGAAFLRRLDLTRPLPGQNFLSRLEVNWPAALAELWQWKAAIEQDFAPDLVCNLTPSTAGRLLGRFLAGDAALSGFGLNEWGFGVTPPWAAFFQGAAQRRSVSPFNLVDLFRAVAGKKRGEAGDAALLLPEAGGLERIIRAGEEAAGATGWVALQLGASESRRRWPVEYFSALGDALWREQRLLPLLLGSADEAGLAARYRARAQGPCLDLCGKTSLPELALTLSRCRLLVSNDTGTMHLAAGLGCPVLGIFLATAQCWDTGPYQNNSCSLEPGLECHPCSFGAQCRHGLRCRHAIPPGLVQELCLGFLRNGVWPAPGKNPVQWPEEKGGHSFDPLRERPRIWQAGLDAYGFMDLRSLSGHEEEARSLWFREQRHFLRQFLDRDTGKPFLYLPPAEQFLLPQPEKAKLTAELEELRAQLSLLLELGGLLQKKPLAPLRRRFINALHKSSSAFEASAYLLSLSLLWRTEIEEQGEKLEYALDCAGQYLSLISGLLRRVRPD